MQANIVTKKAHPRVLNIFNGMCFLLAEQKIPKNFAMVIVLLKTRLAM